MINHLVAENIAKAFNQPSMSKKAEDNLIKKGDDKEEGHWVTVRGKHIHIGKDGQIDKGNIGQHKEDKKGGGEGKSGDESNKKNKKDSRYVGKSLPTEQHIDEVSKTHDAVIFKKDKKEYVVFKADGKIYAGESNENAGSDDEPEFSFDNYDEFKKWHGGEEKIYKVFYCRIPNSNFIFPDGSIAAFTGGRYVTDDPDKANSCGRSDYDFYHYKGCN